MVTEPSMCGDSMMQVMVRNTFLDAPSGMTPQHMADARSAASPILASAPASLARSQRRARRLSHGRFGLAEGVTQLSSAVANLHCKLDAAANAPAETPSTNTGASPASSPWSGEGPETPQQSANLDVVFAAVENSAGSTPPPEVHYSVRLLDLRVAQPQTQAAPPPPPLQPPKLPAALQGCACSPEPPRRAAAGGCLKVLQTVPVVTATTPLVPKFAPPAQPPQYASFRDQTILPSPPRWLPETQTSTWFLPSR